MTLENVYYSVVLCATLCFVQVLCLFGNTNVTEVMEYLEVCMNESLAYKHPIDFSPFVKTTNEKPLGK